MDKVAVAVVIPFGVAVSKEGAAGTLITNNPVFIKILTAAGSMDDDGIAPGQATIGRTIDNDGCSKDRAPRDGNGERGNHPDVVPGIEGDCGIAYTVVGICRVDDLGDAWQKTIGPGSTIIGGGGKSDVRTAS